MFIVLIILLFWLPILIAPVGAVWAAGIGLRALLQSVHSRQPYTTTLRFLALNLCEPLLNGAIVALLVFPVIGIPLTGIVTVPYTRSGLELGLLLTLPMAVLLLPAAGLSFAEPICRNVCRGLLLSGLLRWAITFLLWWATYAYRRQNTPYVPFHILLLEGLALFGLWWSIQWGRRQLAMIAERAEHRPAWAADRAPAGTARTAPAGGRIRIYALPVLLGGLLLTGYLLSWLSFSTLPPMAFAFWWEVDQDPAVTRPWEPVAFSARLTSRMIRGPAEEFLITAPDLPAGWRLAVAPEPTLRVAPGATEQVVIRIIPADTGPGTYHFTVGVMPVYGHRHGPAIMRSVSVTLT